MGELGKLVGDDEPKDGAELPLGTFCNLASLDLVFLVARFDFDLVFFLFLRLTSTGSKP